MTNIGSSELLVLAGLICVPVLLAVLIVGVGVAVMRPRQKRVKCPYCAELILPDAKVCRYCGRDLQLTSPNNP